MSNWTRIEEVVEIQGKIRRDQEYAEEHVHDLMDEVDRGKARMERLAETQSEYDVEFAGLLNEAFDDGDDISEYCDVDEGPENLYYLCGS